MPKGTPASVYAVIGLIDSWRGSQHAYPREAGRRAVSELLQSGHRPLHAARLAGRFDGLVWKDPAALPFLRQAFLHSSAGLRPPHACRHFTELLESVLGKTPKNIQLAADSKAVGGMRWAFCPKRPSSWAFIAGP